MARERALLADYSEVAGLSVGAGRRRQPHVGVVVAMLPAKVVPELVRNNARPFADDSPAVGVDPYFVASGRAVGVAQDSCVQERRNRAEFDGQAGAVNSEFLTAEVRSQKIDTGLYRAH